MKEHIGSGTNVFQVDLEHIAAGAMKQLNNHAICTICKLFQEKVLEILCVGASRSGWLKLKRNLIQEGVKRNLGIQVQNAFYTVQLHN